jgi:hypothetical protein
MEQYQTIFLLECDGCSGRRSGSFCGLLHYPILHQKCPCKNCILKMICNDNCIERENLRNELTDTKYFVELEVMANET